MVISSAIITKDKLHSQSWANIFNVINDNLTDPTGSVGRNWIHTRPPSIKSGTNAGYPLIIIWPVKISKRKQSISATKRDIMWESEIEIRTSDSINGSGSGAIDMETINDALDVIFDGETNKKTLRNYNMAFVTLDLIDNDYIEMKQESIYVSRFILTFKKRLDLT